MNAHWTVPVFTPAKFALLALAAVAITLGASGIPTPHQSTEQATTLSSVSYGQSNGPRTEAVYYFIPASPVPIPDRSKTLPLPAPIIHRTYPPL